MTYESYCPGGNVSLRDMKLLMLEMLDEIDWFCAKHGITYYLVGGSVLGAIRHQGFIPWDDDIDIGMPRDDYERFIATYTSSNSHTLIVDYRKTKHYVWPFAKMIHGKTVLIEQGCERCPIGVYIDIFPIDRVEGTYEDACKKLEKVHFYKDLFELKYLKVDKKRSLIKNTVILLSRVLQLVSDRKLIENIVRASMVDKNATEYKYVCNYLGAWGKKEIIPAEYVSSIIRHKFEDREYCIPERYDQYLTKIYGDYMTPPPPEKQVSHHNYEVYWK